MEIEKKYLLSGLPFDMSQYERLEITQAYISTSPVIRLRKQNDSHILTIKGKGRKLEQNVSVKEEFELELTESEFSDLFALVDKRTTPIEKTRYIVPLDENLTAELDEYHGTLTGLYTVEVEFPNLTSAGAFVPPHWFGRNVSDDYSFSNASLSIHGLP